MLYSHLEHHHERVAVHKGRPVFASSKYTLALLGRGVRPKLDYDLLGHTPVTMILECYSHAGSFHFYKYSAYLRRIVRADERTRTAYPCSNYE
jgi:hypothetical protein